MALIGINIKIVLEADCFFTTPNMDKGELSEHIENLIMAKLADTHFEVKEIKISDRVERMIKYEYGKMYRKLEDE